MRTRCSFFPPNSTIPRRSRKQTTIVVEPEFCTIVTMADNRTMAQMLQAPIEAVLVLSGQPILVGRPYRTQPIGALKMLTSRKSVRSLPTHRLASRYPSDSSSLIHSSSGYAISDYMDDLPTTTSVGPSRKRCRSPTSSVPIASPIREALSPVRADLLPPPKRIRDSNFVIDFEVSSEDRYESYVPREASLGVDFEDSYDPYIEPDVDSDIQADIDACIAFADDIRARGTDVKVVLETAAEEVEEDVPDHVTVDGSVKVTYETLGDLVQKIHDLAVEILVHRIQFIKSDQILQGHRITRVDLEVTTMKKRISALEWDYTRLRGMLDVESPRVDQLQRGLSRNQKELR
nr:hypothetical protein [Tanacetum cinerariifolium]